MWDGGLAPPALCLGVVGVAWVYSASWGACLGLVFFFDVWGAFDFVALWAPFLEPAEFRAISAVWGVLDSLDMDALCVALGCVVRGYRMCGCFRRIVEFHCFPSTSIILTKYVMVCGTRDLDIPRGEGGGGWLCSRSLDCVLWGCVRCVCACWVGFLSGGWGVVGMLAVFWGLPAGSRSRSVPRMVIWGLGLSCVLFPVMWGCPVLLLQFLDGW